MSAFQLDPSEGIIKEEGVLYLKSTLNAQRGRLYVTTQRIVFIKAMNNIQRLMGISPVVCNVPRTTLTGVSQSKQGLNKNVLCMALSDGSEYRFLVNDYSSWAAVLS